MASYYAVYEKDDHIILMTPYERFNDCVHAIRKANRNYEDCGSDMRLRMANMHDISPWPCNTHNGRPYTYREFTRACKLYEDHVINISGVFEMLHKPDLGCFKEDLIKYKCMERSTTNNRWLEDDFWVEYCLYLCNKSIGMKRLAERVGVSVEFLTRYMEDNGFLTKAEFKETMAKKKELKSKSSRNKA